MTAPSKTTPAPTPRSAEKQMLIDSTLRGQIVRGELRPGQRLPTWDEFEKQFGVSRVTLMRGIAALKADGFIVPAGSRGTFVAEHPPHLYRIGLALPYRRHDGAQWSQFWEAICQQAEVLSQQGPYHFEFYHSLGWTTSASEATRLREDASHHRLAGVIAMAHAAGVIEQKDLLGDLPIPTVGLTGDMTSPYAAAAYPDLQNFRERTMAYVARVKPGARVGMIIDANSPDDKVVQSWRREAQAHGLSLPTHLIQCAAWAKAVWAANLAQLLVRLPKNERPEALVIADEHLLQASIRGLQDAGLKPGQDIAVVSHANFPLTQEPEGVECIGFDVPQLLRICIDAIVANPGGPKASRSRQAVAVPAILVEEWREQQDRG